MVDFLYNLYPRLLLCSGYRMTTQFPQFVVIVCTIEFICTGTITFGDLDGGYLEVILGLPGCVGAEEEAVGCVGFVGWSG